MRTIDDVPRLTPLLRIIFHVLLGWRVRNAGTIQTDDGLECEIKLRQPAT